MKTILISLLLLCGNNPAKAQQPVDSLIINEWFLESYTIDGKKMPLSPNQKESRHIFYKDHTSKAVDGGGETVGIWAYDSRINSIVITNSQQPDIKTLLKIKRITAKSMVVSVDGENNMLINMKAVN